MRQASVRLPGRRQRAGFTLVELLVVLTIIAVLVALATSAVFRFIFVQQNSNTKTMLQKLQSQMNKQWNAVKEKAYREPIPSNYQTALATLAGTDPNATARLRVIWVKLRLKQAFPMSFNEILYPGTYDLPALPGYVSYLTNLGVTRPAVPPATQPYESAACLLMALQRGESGGGINAEDLGVSGSLGNFSLSARGSAQSIQAPIDAWGSPLLFARWPTGSTELNPNGAQAGLNDLGDPEGRFADPVWLTYLNTNGLRTTFESTLHKIPDRTTGPQSYKLSALIVSAGPDKALGLNTTTLAVTTTADAQDNLYSPHP